MSSKVDGRRLFEIIEDDEYCDSSSIPNAEDRLTCNWYRLLISLCNGGQTFTARFRADELLSIRNLVDWWLAEHETLEVQQLWVAHLSESSIDFRIDRRDVTRLMRLPHPRERKDFGRSDTRYHRAMLALLGAEFSTLSILTIKETREQAALRSYARHCGTVVYRQIEGLDGKDDLPFFLNDELNRLRTSLARWIGRSSPTPSPCPWLHYVTAEVPFYLWDRVACRTVETHLLPPSAEYVAVSHTWGRYKLETEVDVDGVSWRIPRNSLFDVSRLSSILAQVPGGTRYVWLDLVCIPQDRSAIAVRKIGRQAQIFKSAKHCIVWLNTMENFDVLELVARYMAISLFELDPSTTSPTTAESSEEIIQWVRDRDWQQMTLKLSGLFQPWEDLIFRELPEPQPWFTSLWTLQEICLRPDMWVCTRDWKPLTLDSKGQHRLSLEGLLSLHSLIQLGGVTFGDGDEVIDHPQFLPHRLEDELNHLDLLTGLSGIWDSSRVQILTMADLKYCSNKTRRAEAIMSAIGAVEWYQDYHKPTADAIQPLPLMLDKYPIAFVEEVKHKLGARLFMSGYWDFDVSMFPKESLGNHREHMIRQWTMLIEDLATSLTFVNIALHPGSKRSFRQILDLTASTFKSKYIPPYSLLPFGTTLGLRYARYIVDLSEAEMDMYTDHASISSWRFMQDGSGTILISQIALICSLEISLDDSAYLRFVDHDLFEAAPELPQHGCLLRELQDFIWTTERSIYAVVTMVHMREKSALGVLLEMVAENVAVCLGRFELILVHENGIYDYESEKHDELDWTREFHDAVLDPPWALI